MKVEYRIIRSFCGMYSVKSDVSHVNDVTQKCWTLPISLFGKFSPQMHSIDFLDVPL